MKTVLIALLAFAGSAHAVTTCTDSVKQIAADIGGNARVYVLLMNGAGFDIFNFNGVGASLATRRSAPRGG